MQFLVLLAICTVVFSRTIILEDRVVNDLADRGDTIIFPGCGNYKLFLKNPDSVSFAFNYTLKNCVMANVKRGLVELRDTVDGPMKTTVAKDDWANENHKYHTVGKFGAETGKFKFYTLQFGVVDANVIYDDEISLYNTKDGHLWKENTYQNVLINSSTANPKGKNTDPDPDQSSESSELGVSLAAMMFAVALL